MKKTYLAFILLTAIFGILAAIASGGVNSGSTYVFTLPEETAKVVPATHSRIVRNENEICINTNSRELPEGAYTQWWAVFNKPEECQHPNFAGGACDLPDLLAGQGDPTLFWASGQTVGPDGRAYFSACVPVGGEVPGQELFPGGIKNRDAEIHTIHRYHGPSAYDNAADLGAQLTEFEGLCDVFECVDVQATVHIPRGNNASSGQLRTRGGAGSRK